VDSLYGLLRLDHTYCLSSLQNSTFDPLIKVDTLMLSGRREIGSVEGTASSNAPNLCGFCCCLFSYQDFCFGLVLLSIHDNDSHSLFVYRLPFKLICILEVVSKN
jgi:hypothetical protein